MPSSTQTLTNPLVGFGAPKDRMPPPVIDTGLPAATQVISADNHISVAVDIFYEGFPGSMRDKAPRIMNVDGGWVLGQDGRSLLVKEFIDVLQQYDPTPGSHTGDVPARLDALDSEGIHAELAFPNAICALFGWPDREVRELCFRLYNQHIADVQERSGGRIMGAGLINWWDAAGTRRTLEELKALGLKTFLLPLSPGKYEDKRIIDFASREQDAVWDVIEEVGLPVSHHIGENPPATPNEHNPVAVGMLQSVAPFRDMFGKYIIGGILDRHPGLRIGWFEGGINWVPSAIQDAQHIVASFQHLANHRVQHDPQDYWDRHMMASFMLDPLGLELLDRIGADKVMWSTDFPHNESTFGYSQESIRSVVAAVGPERAGRIVGANVKSYLGIPG
jgi:predicted TIM-barrel fold metal-dependent hydrolase